MPSINRHVALMMRMGERFINRSLAGTGVSSSTGLLLLELRDGGDRNPSALALAVGVDKSHVTRSLRALERAGLVSMAPEPGDARMLTVSLTEQGRVAAGQVESAMLAWIGLVSDGVTASELATVEAVFDKFYANGSAYFAGHGDG